MATNSYDEDRKLDEEFRNIIRIIKARIPCITNLDNLMLYKIWLEKLSQNKFSERAERNRYLSELCRQIEKGVLEPPFTILPSPGALPLFRNALETTDNKELQFYHTENTRKLKTQMYTDDVSRNSNILVQIIRNGQNQKMVQMAETVFSSKLCKQVTPRTSLTNAAFNNILESSEMANTDLSESQHVSSCDTLLFKPPELEEEPVVYYEAEEPDLCLSISETPKSPSFQNHFNSVARKSIQNKSEDSSWCDLSEVSKTLSKLDSGDSARSSAFVEMHPYHMFLKKADNKISDLLSIIVELKKHSLRLSEKAEEVVKSLSMEIKLVKNKVLRQDEEKLTVDNCLTKESARLKGEVAALNKELFETHARNTEISQEIEDLKSKLEESSAQKQKELIVVRESLLRMYTKEITLLKQNYVNYIVDIENQFTSILVEKEGIFNKKLNDLKDLYDKKISDASKSLDL